MSMNTNRLLYWIELLHEECSGNEELINALDALNSMSHLYSDREIGDRLSIIEKRYCS